MNNGAQIQPQSIGWFRKIRDSEYLAYGILLATFLPVTLPNLWATSWRHSLMQLALWIAIFGNRRLAVLMLIPFYLVMPALVFVNQHYSPPSLGLLVPFCDSSFNERRAFLEAIPLNYYWLYLFTAIPVGAAWFFGRQLKKRTPAVVRMTLLLTSVLLMFYWAHRAVFYKHSVFRVVLVERLGSYQPLGLPIFLTFAALDFGGGDRALQERAAFDFDAVRNPTLDNIVFVIGESARADHWSLNGYSRPTTPALEAMPNVLSFSNVISLAPNTVLSWPFLLTLKEPGDSTVWPRTKSFISAFKEAGYDTRFISFYMDQNYYSKNDPRALIAFEADTVINGCAAQRNRPTDVAMLPTIQSVLAAKGPKLVVISTQGSHPGFERTCPLEYNVFRPSILTEKETPETFVNGYDNTIRMTDSLLASIIARLRESRSVLFYISDHGLAVCDNGVNMHEAAFIKPEYRPACIVWASDSFLADATLRTRFDWGRKHVGAPVTTDYVLHSFLDLCDVQTKKLDTTKSLFSSQLIIPKEWKVEDFLGNWHNFADVPDTPK